MLPRLFLTCSKLIKVWTFLLVNIQQTVTQYLIAPHMTSTLTPKGYSPFLLSPPDMVFKAHWLLNVKLCNLFIQIFFFLFCSRCFFFLGSLSTMLWPYCFLISQITGWTEGHNMCALCASKQSYIHTGYLCVMYTSMWKKINVYCISQIKKQKQNTIMDLWLT